jgi:multidrug resistance protein
VSSSSGRDNLGQVHSAPRVIGGPGAVPERRAILLLAGCVALMMTGFGIILPVFARRMAEFGSGVEALGLMAMSFALAQFVAAPFMGSLADRFGRRPLVLVSLAAFAASNLGLLAAPNTQWFIAVRALEGLLTAGLFPAAMGVVADTVPESQRARWVGIVMGSYGAGIILGPVIGGVLYDGWGFSAPFVTSAVLATLALVAAVVMVPETRTATVRKRGRLRERREAQTGAGMESGSFWETLPRPLRLFAILLAVDFAGVFTFTFVEPQMVFYFYETLEWTTIRFGIVVGTYGIAMVFGQVVLAGLSDRFGRTPVILLGILLMSTLFFGLATVTNFASILVVCLVSGLGSALIAPALSAFYLDITAEAHRSRVVGNKESAASPGGAAGPAAVALAVLFMDARAVFVSAGVLTLAVGVLAAGFLRPPRVAADAVETESANHRSMAAGATLRGMVLTARTARDQRVGVGWG